MVFGQSDRGIFGGIFGVFHILDVFVGSYEVRVHSASVSGGCCFFAQRAVCVCVCVCVEQPCRDTHTDGSHGSAALSQG